MIHQERIVEIVQAGTEEGTGLLKIPYASGHQDPSNGRRDVDCLC